MTTDNWQLVSASAEAVLPSRWNILWNYIIKRKALNFSVEAWVTQKGGIADLILRYVWRNK